MEYQNRVAMPELFKNIDRDTNGAVKWKLIPGGQLADGKTTFTAVKDGLMQAGLGIVTYVPNALPSIYAIYSTAIFGENDPVAATGAALETVYLNCPSCLEELRKQNSVVAAGWTSSSYVLTCREPLRTMADLKGKRVRATGGNAEMLKRPAWSRSAPPWSRRSACCSAAGSTASTASSTGCGPSATATSPSTSWIIRSGSPGRRWAS